MIVTSLHREYRICTICHWPYTTDADQALCPPCQKQKPKRTERDKANRRVTANPKPQVVKPALVPKQCARCGTTFTHKWPTKKYCSDECRYLENLAMARENRVLRRPDKPMRNCKQCQEPFVVIHPTKIFCSRKCLELRKSATRRAKRLGIPAE